MANNNKAIIQSYRKLITIVHVADRATNSDYSLITEDLWPPRLCLLGAYNIYLNKTVRVVLLEEEEATVLGFYDTGLWLLTVLSELRKLC